MANSKILYIEDNSQSVRLVQRILESDSYHVITEKNAILGLLVARSQQPDLILMDIHLPWMDGVQALEKLRADGFLSNTPVIAVTANTDYGERERFIKAGFDDYVPKPISRITLLGAISKLLKAQSSS